MSGSGPSNSHVAAKILASGRPASLSACEAARLIARGTLTSRELVADCLDRIDDRDGIVGAWEFIDKAGVLDQAIRCDSRANSGPLHGVPVGIKDIIDTFDMPTGCGSPIYAGNRPATDAECVKRLRAAGAVVLGKTVTTEFAAFQPSRTTNPHNPAHTPGGSSSGSAAAVADYHVPVALGTQTAGSVVRPASFCGVIGYKPSYGRCPLDGVLLSSMILDTLGIFTRTFEDAATVGGVLSAIALRDPVCTPVKPPRIGLFRTPWWSEADTEMRSAVEATAAAITRSGADVSEVTIPGFADLLGAHRDIMLRDLAIARRYEYENYRSQLSQMLREMIEQGLALSISDVQKAIRSARIARREIAKVFTRHDVLLTPAAPGRAPAGLSSTGDPIFNRAWTLLGVPCITYPAAVSAIGLPLGVQVVGAFDSDEELIATTKWISHNATI